MFTKIQPPDVLAKIIGQVKDNIAAGLLRKGDRLPSERQMAEMFGLSRATIREAVKALEMLGLVTCAHGSGNYIAQNLSQSMSEPMAMMFLLERGTAAHTYQLRRAVEFATAGLAAALAQPDEVDALRTLCRAIESGQSEAQKAEFDHQLHLAIARAAQNPLLIALLNACDALLHAHIEGARAMLIGKLQSDSQINRQHAAIVAAIAAGDVRRAEQAMLAHIDLIAEHSPVPAHLLAAQAARWPEGAL